MAQASVLYADGYAVPQPLGEWLQEPGTWGGKVALHRSLLRLQSQNPLLGQVETALAKDDEKTVAALLTSHPDQSRTSLDGVLALWKASWQQESITADVRDGDLDTLGWGLARAAGSGSNQTLLQAMDAEIGRQLGAELAKVQADGWQEESSESGFVVERPRGWTVETREEGRYHRTYFHSGSPYVSAMVEAGERDSEGPDAPLDWSGMERTFQRQLGARYARVQMSEDMLGNETAGH